MRRNVLEVKDLVRNYRKSVIKESEEDVKVLKGISFQVAEGEFVGIMGKSGCGKTTLLKTLGMIDKPTDGTIKFMGEDTSELYGDKLADIRNSRIGFIFQDFYLMDSLSVEENIMLPMIISKQNINKMIDKTNSNYPYDIIWMARQNDEKYSEKIAEKYNGTVKHIPMIRATMFYSQEEIGISESTYKELTGKAYGLSGKEIVIGIEDQNYQREEKVTDKVLYDLFGWLYIGKFNPNKKEFESSNILKDANYQYRIKEIHTQNVFGKFVPEDAGEGCEDTVIFSDEYFDKQWKKQAADDEEVSMLEAFSFPKTKEQMAWKEIKDHADKEGITVFQPDDSHSPHAICYNKTVFLKEQKISNIFLLFSKLFILITLLISGVFIMVVKNLAEMSSYQRRYEFFHSMGMKQKEQKKNLSFEICSVGNIALGTGICLALLYVMTYSHWYEAMGEKISTAFWSYWLKLVGIYIIIQIVVQKLFVRYVNKRI